jgi:recombination protein RecA
MSSAVIRAALPSPLLPLETPFPEPGRSRLPRLPRGVVPGSQLEVRPAPATVPSGITQIDALTGGLPRGALTEIFGPASSGRTSMVLTALADATRRQEVCALVDAGDSLHPESAAAVGLDLQRLLWIRCGENSPPQRHRGTEAIEDLKSDDCRLKNQKPASSPRINGSGSNRQSSIINRQSRSWDHRLEQVLKTTDLLLQSGGFGMVVVDLADVPPRFARRIPLASWFRFRRAVENTPTVLLVVEQEPYAKTCASLVLKMQPAALEKQHSAFADQHSAISTQHSAQVAFVQKRPVQCEETPKQPFFSHHSPAHAQILRGLPVEAEIVHARLQRKPVHSAAQFHTRAAWAKSLAG